VGLPNIAEAPLLVWSTHRFDHLGCLSVSLMQLALQFLRDPESGRRYHVEIYSPSKLHPSKRNAYVWAADDLRMVRNTMACLLLDKMILLGLVNVRLFLRDDWAQSCAQFR